MNNVNYFRGLTVNQQATPIGPASASIALIYDISGKGWTRLSGMFGFSQVRPPAGAVNEEGTITVTCAISGRFLGGYTINNPAGGRTDAPVRIDIDITGVEEIRILLQVSGGRGATLDTGHFAVGFGDAFFE
jgi:hypothetical protein